MMMKLGLLMLRPTLWEEILHSLLLSSVAVDQVFAGSTHHNLSRDTDLRIFVESDRTLILVIIVEHNGHASFGDACLASLVD